MYPVLLYGQVVFELVGDCPVEDLREHFAEQSCNHEGQNNDQHSRSQVKKQPAAGNQGDEKAVGSHAVKTRTFSWMKQLSFNTLRNSLRSSRMIRTARIPDNMKMTLRDKICMLKYGLYFP